MPTHYQGTPQEVLALNTFIKLTRATDSVLARLAKIGTYSELTISQFGTLETIYHLGPMCQNAIGAKLLSSPGNLSLVLDNLEKRGLVDRQRDAEDRRRVVVSLTPTGHDLIASVLPAHVAAIAEIMSALSPDEQLALGQLCRKLGKSTADHRTTTAV